MTLRWRGVRGGGEDLGDVGGARAREEKDAGGNEIKRKAERKEERGRKRKGGEKEKKRREVGGHFRDSTKNRGGWLQDAGGGKGKSKGKTLGFWRLGGLGPVVLLSRLLKFLFSFVN